MRDKCVYVLVCACIFVPVGLLYVCVHTYACWPVVCVCMLFFMCFVCVCVCVRACACWGGWGGGAEGSMCLVCRWTLCPCLHVPPPRLPPPLPQALPLDLPPPPPLGMPHPP